MTENELVLSWMLWLLFGWLIGYRYHVLQVNRIVARRTQRVLEEAQERALDRLLADVAVSCLGIPTIPTNPRVN